MQTIKSQGIFLTQFGAADKAFELRDFTIDVLGDDAVLIETEAFGINYADVMARNKLYKETPPLPALIGYEVVGKIIQIGKNIDPERLQERVIAFTRFGGYAKHAVTLASATSGIGTMPAEEALALSTQFVTAYYMSEFISTVREGDQVLIHAAAGGVGTALIQLCKWKKAFVFAKVGADSKAALVKKLGADVVINYNNEDYEAVIKSHLKNKKLDISFNPVAGSTFKKDMRLLGAGGKIIEFGASEMSGKKWGIFSTLNFARKMGIVIPVGLMMQSKSILGVNMLKVGDQKPEVLAHCLTKVVALTKEGILQPQVGGKYAASDIAKAHAYLESGKSTGKISVFWD